MAQTSMYMQGDRARHALHACSMHDPADKSQRLFPFPLRPPNASFCSPRSGALDANGQADALGPEHVGGDSQFGH